MVLRLALFATLALLAVPPLAQAELRAGAGRADITPPVGTPMFAYTARSGLANPGNTAEVLSSLVSDPGGDSATTFVPSRGIHTRLRARALVLEREGRKLALVQADLGGLPRALAQAVAAGIEGTGIAADDLLLSATHTHAATGPIWPNDSFGYALLGGDLFDRATFQLTADGIAAAVRAADARLVPARAGSATSELRGASSNRNFTPFRRNRDVPASEPEARRASIDPTVTVLRVEGTDGRPIAAWSSFAVHPTSLDADNRLFSGDNVATAARVAEERIRRLVRRRHPVGSTADFVNVWANGAEGDISPRGEPARHSSGEALEYAAGDLARANLTGLRVAGGIVEAWRRAGGSLSPDPVLGAAETLLALDGTAADGEPVGPLPVLGLGGIVGPDGACSPIDGLAGPGQGRKLPLAGGPLVPNRAPISIARVGELAVAAFPFEITRQMGRRIRDALAGAAPPGLSRIALAGLTDAYLSYTATPEEYDACHYEGSFTLFGRRQGPRLLSGALELMRGFAGGGRMPEAASEPPYPLPGGSARRAPQTTPAAGEIVEQPGESVSRPAVVAFRWRGGDPLLEARRDEPFVLLERHEPDEWRAVASEDSPLDTVERGGKGVWTERFQVRECSPAGIYRFRVRGMADRGAGAAAYEAISRSFRVERSRDLRVVATERLPGRRVLVRARYPEPDSALASLPRLVTTGSARIPVRLRGRRLVLRARPSTALAGFTARLPRGARLAGSPRVRDRCGNTTG